MSTCYLCNGNRPYFQYYCEKCNLIKRMISLHGLERVYEILENVLMRDTTKQNNKVKLEIKKEIEDQQLKLADSTVLYDNKSDVLQELKEKLKKK